MKKWKRLIRRHRQRAGIALIAMLALIDAGLGFYFLDIRSDRIEALAVENMSFAELKSYFQNLAHKEGAVNAFIELDKAKLKPNVDIHLLGHAVGDMLYDQKGTEGMLDCTSAFRNACSHQIVINTLIEKGPGSFPLIVETCERAPGGINGYNLCFHGLGHGVLAYNGYDLALASSMCELAGEGRPKVECVGGAIMEMMAGVHDPAIWKDQSKKYLSSKDPLSPCNLPFIPKEAKGVCYMYLTPHLFEVAGKTPGRQPTTDEIQRAFSYCSDLEGNDRRTCYGGFGKEFAPMANERDIRTLAGMSDKDLKNVISWCSLARARDGVRSCISEAVGSLYWAGDNDPSVSMRFCALADEHSLGKACFDRFLGAVNFYKKDERYRKDICEDISDKYKEICKTKLL